MSFWSSVGWAIFGALAGTAAGAGLAVAYFGPLENEREIAMQEMSLLTDQLHNCSPEAARAQVILAFPTSSSGGEGVPIDRVPVIDEALEEIALLQGEAQQALTDDRNSEAREILRTASRLYEDSHCFRDVEWERRIREMTLCEAANEAGVRYQFIRANDDAKDCRTEETQLPLCLAIYRDDLETLRTSDGEETDPRIVKACNGFP